ncbi:MAG: hypothetical protein SFT92_05760 [Rickettsiales bacterium]|nr:hypothetical protein [Rickettsiales bacterium]
MADVPANFSTCMEWLNKSAPLNATVARLNSPDIDYSDNYRGSDDWNLLADSIRQHDARKEVMRALTEELAKYNMKNFIPLTRATSQSSVAGVLYAGDGIVAKITDKSYLPPNIRPMNGVYTKLPGVLPPMISFEKSGFIVEIYPWIDTKSVGINDVEKMKKYLSSHNLRFQQNDDRIDNVGRLPNGKLAILDANAVEVIDPSQPIDTKAVHEWTAEVYKNFGRLYGDIEKGESHPKLVGNSPDFTPRFHASCKVMRRQETGWSWDRK